MQHKYHFFLIFITGCSVLALEILASRVETPYFGVSLYIWSAILATTLLFLAAGYYAGGVISTRLQHAPLEVLFLSAPLLASLSIFFACLVYPLLFPVLGRINLLLGSFVGAILLLGIPLICLSAMNPILIALSRRPDQPGDAGAGRVFFISTTGSVLGVFITAFFLIPNTSNYNALLSVSLLLILVVILTIVRGSCLYKKRLLLASLICASLGITLLMFKQDYLDQLAALQRIPQTYRVMAEYHTHLGNTKVVAHTGQQSGTIGYQTLIQDGHVLNNTLPDGTSLDSYTYILEALAYMFNPNSRQVLVLGLGAGIVPMRMNSKGSMVTVVELDEGVIEAAQQHFGFHRSGIILVQEDARTFVRDCPQTYDVVIVDLFQGDGIPDYLMTQEFFSDIKTCLASGGVVVMNSLYDVDNSDLNMYIPATVARSFPVIYQALWSDAYRKERHFPIVNRYLVARDNVTSLPLIPTMENIPARLRGEYDGTLATLIRLSSERLAFVPALDDEHNFYNVVFAKTQMTYRYRVLQTLSPLLLVN